MPKWTQAEQASIMVGLHHKMSQPARPIHPELLEVCRTLRGTVFSGDVFAEHCRIGFEDGSVLAVDWYPGCYSEGWWQVRSHQT